MVQIGKRETWQYKRQDESDFMQSHFDDPSLVNRAARNVSIMARLFC